MDDGNYDDFLNELGNMVDGYFSDPLTGATDDDSFWPQYDDRLANVEAALLDAYESAMRWHSAQIAPGTDDAPEALPSSTSSNNGYEYWGEDTSLQTPRRLSVPPPAQYPRKESDIYAVSDTVIELTDPWDEAEVIGRTALFVAVRALVIAAVVAVVVCVGLSLFVASLPDLGPTTSSSTTTRDAETSNYFDENGVYVVPHLEETDEGTRPYVNTVYPGGSKDGLQHCYAADIGDGWTFEVSCP